MRPRLLLAFAFATLAATARPALADVPPPDSCSAPGQACNNAIGQGTFGEPGTCTMTTCQRATPDGKVQTYNCLRCIGTNAFDAGAPDADVPASDAGGGGSTTSDGGSGAGAGSGDGNGGCSTAGLGRDAGLAGAMLAVGALALGLARRRR